MDRTYAEPVTGDTEPIDGDVIPGPGTRLHGEVRSEPRKPGALRLMWRQHGPFIKPFLWIGDLRADAALAHRATGLEVRVLLTIVPATVLGVRAMRRTRKGTPERLHALVPWAAGFPVARGRGNRHRA